MTSDPSNRPHFQIRLRRGDLELEVTGSDKSWVDDKLGELKRWLGADAEMAVQGAFQEVAAAGPSAKDPSLTELVRSIEPASGLEYVLAIGYYLERYSRLRGGFRRRDVAEAFKVLKYHHSNPGVPIAAGRRQGLLMDGEEHEKIQLTESGERWVEERTGR